MIGFFPIILSLSGCITKFQLHNVYLFQTMTLNIYESPFEVLLRMSD